MSHKETATGGTVTVEFEGARCIHSRHCVLDRPDVFVAGASGADWMHPERATEDEMLELAHNCPSGAIFCRHADGTAMESAPPVNTVRVMENGPLTVHAAITLAGVADGFRRTLCRCGASKKKPYCDGSHTEIGFTASGEPSTVPSEPLAERGGPLAIDPTRNGPLHLTGAVEIICGSGRTVTRTTDAWLCRCGASQNKPFCDGSHVKAGFRSE